MRSFIFTSESVTEGHPDKVCDLIADSILDAHIAQDPGAHVACEVLCKGGKVVIAGEITSTASVDVRRVARDTIAEIGYTDPAEEFCAERVEIEDLLAQQSEEIRQAVDRPGGEPADQGAGDQGIMFGYATDETPELMPLPILLAHRLARGLAEDRKSRRAPRLRPDGKTQVSVRYEEGQPVRVEAVLVSTQHHPDVVRADLESYVRDALLPRALGGWHREGIRLLVNPSGSFVQGGPSADCGLTGRKIIVDTYGGAARHGGGAFSGKDPSKVDRSAAYFCRYVARQTVRQGLARRAEVQVAYAIGEQKPMSILVETFGTGASGPAERFAETFEFTPDAIVAQLDLRRPIYRQTTNYGHFGKPGLPWES